MPSIIADLRKNDCIKFSYLLDYALMEYSKYTESMWTKFEILPKHILYQ